MKKKNQQLLESLQEIKYLLSIGTLSYDEAKEKAEPFLKQLNEKGEKVAEKFGQRYSQITFTSFMR